MNRGVPGLDAKARRLDLVRLHTGAIEPRYRLQLVGDVLGRQFCNGDASGAPDRPFWCDWTIALLGPGSLIGSLDQGGFSASRGGRRLADGDGDVTLFFCRRGIGQIEQGERRTVIRPGEMGILHHGRDLDSHWPDTEVRVLRLPRSAVPKARLEAAGGAQLGRFSSALALLNPYVEAAWPLALAGTLPAVAADHLAELGTLALNEAAGQDAPLLRQGPAANAARHVAMQAILARRFAEPMLSMRHVAAAIGLSERAGYLVFEAAGVSFSETLLCLRLDAASHRLAAGYQGRITDLAYDVGFSDLSHFNRRFRARFGMTPTAARRPAHGLA